MKLKDTIKDINKTSLAEINTFHRYHEDSHQDSSTLRDIEFWLKLSPVVQEVTILNDYVESIIMHFKNDPDIHILWQKYESSINQYQNELNYSFKNVEDDYYELAEIWNSLESKDSRSIWSKKNLDIRIFDRQFNYEGVDKNICVLWGGPLMGKTHTLIHFVKKYQDNYLVSIFFANFFETNTTIKDSLSSSFKMNWDDLLNYLNQEGIKNNQFSVVIIDGINEQPNFNKQNFWQELKEIKQNLQGFPYVKLLISIRQEYIDWSLYRDKEFYVLPLEKLSFSAMYNLCTSLKITQHFNVLSEEPAIFTPGFCYIIANTLEKMSPEDKENLTIFSKQDFFRKYWEQIQERCNQKISSNTTPKMVLDKILKNILKSDSLRVSLDEFTEDEHRILNFFQEEHLISITSNNVGFSYQYYSDYYLINYIESNWGKETKKTITNIPKWILYILSQLISIPIITDMVISIIMNTSKQYFPYFKFHLLSYLLGRKYSYILDKIKLSEEQKTILIEHLRDKYKYELPIDTLIKNKDIENAWIQSIKNMSYEQLSQNTKIIDILNSKKCSVNTLINSTFPHHIFLIHSSLFTLSMKKRDSYYSELIYSDVFEYEILEYITNMNTEQYKKVFSKFSLDKKINELYRLIWVLNVPHREIRDKSTITLIFLLQDEVSLYLHVWDEFKEVNDPYIVERIFLVGYGIVINNRQPAEDLINLAQQLYNFGYPSNKHAYPHIMIQEYSLRIYIWLLKHDTWQQPNHIEKHAYDLSFIELMSIYPDNIEDWIGYICNASIRLEIEGGYGDWGRYVYQYSLEKLVESSKNMDNNMFYEEIEIEFNDYINQLKKKYPKHQTDIQKLKDNTSISFIPKPTTLPSRLLSLEELQEIEKELSYRQRENKEVRMPISFDEFDHLLKNNDKNIFSYLGKHYIIQRIILDYVTILDTDKKNFEVFDTPTRQQGRGRQPHRKERFTKKIQWIGMFEYLGHLRNHLNYIPKLSRVENLLYAYKFIDNIQEKLLGRLFQANKIENDSFDDSYNYWNLFFEISPQIDISLYSTTQDKFSYFNDMEEYTLEQIDKLDSQKDLYKIYKLFQQTDDVSVTKDDKEYIQDIFLKDNNWICIYGVESFSNEHLISFGMRAIIYNKRPSRFPLFNIPYVNYEVQECFLEPSNKNNEDDYISLIWQYREDLGYSFTGQKSRNREMLNPNFVSQYNLYREDKEYYNQSREKVVYQKDGLWYMCKEFLKVITQDYVEPTWYCYFEKRKSANKETYYFGNEWDAYLKYDVSLNKMCGQFNNREKNKKGFRMPFILK